MSKMIDGRWQRTWSRPYRSWGDWMFEDDEDYPRISGLAANPYLVALFDDNAIWTNREGSC